MTSPITTNDTLFISIQLGPINGSMIHARVVVRVTPTKQSILINLISNEKGKMGKRRIKGGKSSTQPLALGQKQHVGLWAWTQTRVTMGVTNPVGMAHIEI